MAQDAAKLSSELGVRMRRAHLLPCTIPSAPSSTPVPAAAASAHAQRGTVHAGLATPEPGAGDEDGGVPLAGETPHACVPLCACPAEARPGGQQKIPTLI